MSAINSKTSFVGQNKTLVLVENLMVGMYVCELDRPWSESPFLFQGFLIQNQEILCQVQRECEYVYIDNLKRKSIFSAGYTHEIINTNKKALAKKNVASARKTSQKKLSVGEERGFNRLRDIIDRNIDVDEIQPPRKIKTFEQEITTAQKIHVKTSHAIKSVLYDAGTGKVINSGVATSAIYECMHSILRTPDAMMLMTHLRSKNEFIWQHSMSVAILAISFGRYLNLRFDELITLGLCGMLHDIGKVRIPSKLLCKTDINDPVERKLLRAHTALGYKILSSTPGISKVIADVAHSHHERLDGKGYPQCLPAERISPFTRMIAIVNKYDSLTADRPGRPGMTHLEAINELFDACGTEIDETLVNSFVQCIGVYPAGSIVETHSGEVGLVIEVNQKLKLRPKIIVVLSKEKKLQPRKIIDLADSKYQVPGNQYTIRTIIRPDKYGVDLNQYYQYGIIQKGIAAR